MNIASLAAYLVFGVLTGITLPSFVAWLMG
jgi:hypothetical protein